MEVELHIKDKLKIFPVSEEIWDEFYLDQEINDRGILVDKDFVDGAIKVSQYEKEYLINKMKDITGIENPNSVMQVKDWLKINDYELDSLSKKDVSDALDNAPEDIKEVLEIRQKLSKSSVKKYTAMVNSMCKDNRVRGMFRFYGANRTGRFAGRLVQLQNLPRNYMNDLEEARNLVKTKNYDALEMLYDDIPDTLSQLIRTSFIPKDNRKFIVADFSAIEARVIAYLANENWRLEVFEKGKDIYCMSASQMFGVPVEKSGINGDLRQKGKIAELACGYGGSVGALKAMGAIDMGLKEEELKPLVDSWRSANPNIVGLWWNIDGAVKQVIKNKSSISIYGLTFFYKSGFLFIELPSKRILAYVKPRIIENRFGGESVTYEGVGSTKKWERIESYGPKFVENIVQAIARDILLYSMKNLRLSDIVATVHDEIIIEADKGVSLNLICEQMAKTPPWAKGLLLDVDGYECEVYKKD
ncbi:DNA polymerase [Helcococcus bovis]|uniref:DNA-directed DNA polymerase n=1 Tax=Helcococcus bovis TaxID=3153252 RepID=A0ABW9F627_9FIRM